MLFRSLTLERHTGRQPGRTHDGVVIALRSNIRWCSDHFRRLKNGSPPTHPLTGKELRALRRLQREQELKSPFVFTSERGTPFTKRGFQAMVERAGEAAGFDMKIHPHMLRHACGFKLANDGVDTRTIQAYLGHKSIQHTVRYTELAPTRSKAYSGTDRARTQPHLRLPLAAPLPEARRIFQENLDECSMGPFLR